MIRKIALQTLVLLIVLAIWISQSFFKTHRTEVVFPISFSHQNERIIIKGKNTDTMPVVVEGRGLDILRFKRSNQYYVGIDTRDLEVGENVVTITESNIFIEDQLPGGVLKFYLNKKLNLELSWTERIVLPVSLRYLTLEDENLYLQRNALVRPKNVEIFGPSEVVSKLRSITTIPLTASLIGSKTRLEGIELEIPEGVNSIKPDVIDVILESHGIVTRTIPLIPIDFPKDKFTSIIPPTVTVKVEGLSGTIQRFDTSTIKAKIILPDEPGNELAQISITTPEGIKVVEYTPKRVQLIKK
jgi:YbbR domain-containing protein